MQTGMGSKGLEYTYITSLFFFFSFSSQLDSEAMHSLGKGCPILNTLLLNDIPELGDDMIQVGAVLLSSSPSHDQTLTINHHSHDQCHCHVTILRQGGGRRDEVRVRRREGG